MDNGYIKLHRSLLTWEWIKDSSTTVVFLYLLLNANWEDSRYKGYDVPKGSLIVGRKKIAETLGISEQSVRTAINHLKSTNEITTKVTNKFTIVTIVNWEKYQCCEVESTNESTNNLTNNQPTTNQQLTTYKEYKNIRIEEYSLVWECYNSICTNLNKCMSLTKPRTDKLTELLDSFSIDEIKAVFEKANKSEWLTGKGKSNWKADFDWLIDIENFVKVQDGRYDNTEKKNDFKKFTQSNYDWDEINKELGIN